MIDWLSSTTAPIEMIGTDDRTCGRASGFFYSRDEDNFFFVTNWHVVVGRDPSKLNIIKYKAVCARLRLHAKVGEGEAISLTRKMEYKIRINDDCGENPVWFEHPIYREQADVVIIKIRRTDLENVVTLRTIGDCDLTPEYKESVMDDVFVIGYPWGLHGGDQVLPLYKRGSIASEPVVDQQGLPRFLIDCRTAESMSGSPVICSHSGIWMPNGKVEPNTTIGTVRKFVGVYSGRLYGHDVEDERVTDIGQVWKKRVIDEIIASGVPGRKFSEL